MRWFLNDKNDFFKNDIINDPSISTSVKYII